MKFEFKAKSIFTFSMYDLKGTQRMYCLICSREGILVFLEVPFFIHLFFNKWMNEGKDKFTAGLPDN